MSSILFYVGIALPFFIVLWGVAIVVALTVYHEYMKLLDDH